MAENDGQLWAEVRALRKENREQHGDIIKLFGDLEGRVRKLENWRSWLAGGMTVIGFLLGIITNQVFL